MAEDRLKPEAKDAIPALMVPLREDTGDGAAAALSGLGSDAVLPLTLALTNHSAEVRATAGLALRLLQLKPQFEVLHGGNWEALTRWTRANQSRMRVCRGGNW